MRKLLPAGIVAAALAAVVAAQEQPGGWAGKLFAGSDGRVQLAHDFGVIPRGAQVTHKFPISNIYAVPLTFDKVSTSCGCVEVKHHPTTLQPRATDYIEVSMDTRRMPTPTKTVTVYVSVNHPQYRSTTSLSVTGAYRSDVVLNSANGAVGGLAAFGSVARGQTPTQTLSLAYAGVQDWKVTGVVAVPEDAVTVTTKETKRQPAHDRVAGQVAYDVIVAVRPDATPGTYRREVLLQTNDRNSPTVPVPYEVTVLAPLSVLPSSKPFGDIPLGEERRLEVIVRGPKPFGITKVDGQGDGVSVMNALPTAVQGTLRLTILVKPSVVGPVNKTLTIHTDDNNATATVNITATITP